MSPTQKGGGGTSENELIILSGSFIISLSILLKWNVTLFVFMLLFSEFSLLFYCTSPTVRPFRFLPTLIPVAGTFSTPILFLLIYYSFSVFVLF